MIGLTVKIVALDKSSLCPCSTTIKKMNCLAVGGIQRSGIFGVYMCGTFSDFW